MRLLLLIVWRRRDELESQTGRHPHTRVASVIYEEEREHPRPTGVGRTRGQFTLASGGSEKETVRMSAEAATPIPTYFRVHDGLRIRFADNRANSDTTVLMLAPWPESVWAFRRIWRHVSASGRVVAIDLPGFGHSDSRPDLIAPDTCAAFLASLIGEWGLGAPHIVGPDVGTAAALFLAARNPELLTSLTVGGGAVQFPIQAGGALKD